MSNQYLPESSRAKLKRYFLAGALILFLWALMAASYFLFIAPDSRLEGAALIGGFAAVGLSVLLRNRQLYSGEPLAPESAENHRKGFIGRSSIGGPGQPRPLFGTLLLLQIVVIGLSVATGIDRKEIVIGMYFVAEDATLYLVALGMKRIAGGDQDDESPGNQ